MRKNNLILLPILFLSLAITACNKKLQARDAAPAAAKSASPDTTQPDAKPASPDTTYQNTTPAPPPPGMDAPSKEVIAPPAEPVITTPVASNPVKDIPVTPVPTAPVVKPVVTPTPPVTVPTTPVVKPTPPVVKPNPPIAKPTPPVVVKKPVAPPVVVKKDEPVTASNFIIAAYNVLQKETKEANTACNTYIQHVLKALGYRPVDFLANDFDVAAPKIFKTYKVLKISNATELKRHLWSYRERTGFILQWERTGPHGHIAIVERVGETLYAYDASLGDHPPQIKTTTVDRLMGVNGNTGVRVYSEFTK